MGGVDAAGIDQSTILEFSTGGSALAHVGAGCEQQEIAYREVTSFCSKNMSFWNGQNALPGHAFSSWLLLLPAETTRTSSPPPMKERSGFGPAARGWSYLRIS